MRGGRPFDVALGLSVLGWAVLGALHAERGGGSSTVRLTLVVLNACVGLLFLARHPAVRQASWGAMALCVPSMVVGGVALRMAPAPTDWPWHAQTLFAVGGLGAVVSLVSLGRSFALLPAARRVVVHGPFRLVRHPVYACELSMVLACGLATGPAAVAALAPIATALIVVRIRVEEEILGGMPDYRDYAAVVRWRLVPGVW